MRKLLVIILENSDYIFSILSAESYICESNILLSLFSSRDDKL